jgi:ubiquinone/menaquinone biosynthesis C-methylase UbiE
MAVDKRQSYHTLSPSAANFEAHASSRDLNSVNAMLVGVPQPVARLLDVGCGSGKLTCHLVGRAGLVVGLDLSLELIGLAQTLQREMNIRNLDWVVANIEHPPFPPGTFDIITSSYVLRLTHIPLALEEMAHLVKLNGHIAIQDALLRSPGGSPLPFSHLFATLRHMQRNTQLFGWRLMLRIVAFRLSPAELVRAARVQRMTLAAIERVYRQILPGSNIHKTSWGYEAHWTNSSGTGR